MMSFTGENGSWTSHRRPPVSVSDGVIRQESCANREYSFICPARRRGPKATYWLVASLSAACPEIEVTRPVSRAYSFRASVSCPPEAPGKLAVVNSPAAGSSVVLKPRLIAGTICWAHSHVRPKKSAPPSVTVWFVFCQVRFSSML